MISFLVYFSFSNTSQFVKNDIHCIKWKLVVFSFRTWLSYIQLKLTRRSLLTAHASKSKETKMGLPAFIAATAWIDVRTQHSNFCTSVSGPIYRASPVVSAPWLISVGMALPLSKQSGDNDLNSSSSFPSAISRPLSRDKGTILLCALCGICYILDNLLHIPFMKALRLYQGGWTAHQLFTSLFCHASFDHLFSNLFHLLVFGRFVEEEAGAVGVVTAFLVCGACANIASLILLRTGTPAVLVGASGAIFALFTLAVLVRFRFRPGRIVEAVILSTYVSRLLLNDIGFLAAGAVGRGAPTRINHIAHTSGAFAGVLLVLLLNFIVRNSSPRSKLKPTSEREPSI